MQLAAMGTEFDARTDVARSWPDLRVQVSNFVSDIPHMDAHEAAARWDRLFQAYFESDYAEDVMVQAGALLAISADLMVRFEPLRVAIQSTQKPAEESDGSTR